MANKFTKALSAFLAVIMCLGAMNLAVLAETLDTDKTVWLGDGLSAVVAPGKGGYDFLSVFRDPAHAYEISNHVLNDGNGNAIPQTLVLVETKDEEYTWTPNGEYSLDANYEVLYCCDAITGYVDGVNYKRLNLEDSDYYSPEAAAHIRSIITNSYPYVSLEEMKANLVDAGVDGAADLTRADIIAGVQAAVWYFANGNSDYDYLRSYNVAATPGYGKVMHDFTGEMSAEIQALGNKKTLVDAEAGARVEALADYLKGLTGTYVPRDKMIITKLDIVKATPHANASGVYSSTVRVDLNNSGTSQNDNIKIDIYVNGEVVKTRNIELGKTSYDITVDAKLDDEIKAVISGTQIIPEGVYFYEPEGGREVSQCLVGVASGETSVYADAEMKVTDIPFGGDKVATPLDKNAQVDVTLSVPGEVIQGDVDVVFVLGGGMTANMETIESAIEVFRPLMENGESTVRMGLISLEKGKEIIVDLNSDEAVLDPDTYIDFVTEKFDSINDIPYGTTNLHSQLLEAQKMLDAEKNAKAENKFVFVLATGRTYWFDDANGEQATIVNKVNGTYYWGDYLWRSQRGLHTSLYMLPDRYNDSYEAFFADVEKWVANDGDKYVYTPHFDTNDYSAYVTWEQNNNKDLRALGIAGSRFGNGIVNPVPTAENFITGTMAAIGSENNPKNALNYERAQYECVQVWKELIADGYNCYSICSENPNYQNGSEYIKLGAGYTGTSTTQVGHSFMNYLAKLAGQEEAPTVWDYERDAEGNFLSATPVIRENFFEPIKAEMIHTVCEGSYVEDFIGYEDGKGNFEFMTDKENIKLTVGKETYITTVVEEFDGETAAYAFTKPGADKATFWLDYYYGNGKTTERFVWTFGENVSTENNVALTYKLQLTEMAEDLGDHQVDANLSATLYPPKNPEEEAAPDMFVLFPVPTVDYTVSEAPENFTVSFKSGEASNISFMLIDEATGEVEFLEKIDIGGETSFDIPGETGKISAVFVKQSTSGMFWFAEDVDADVVDATIACLKANNPSYKGYNAIAFGEGAHELEFKKNKFVTYIFEGDAVASDEKDEVIVEVEKDDIAEDVVVDSSESKNNGNKNKDKNKNKNKNK